ncbi:MAG: TonB-dependent receptor, partial [Bacteroidales bacterium]|nr:TonB-dependent receptor [Bacteroidales bacterium]
MKKLILLTIVLTGIQYCTFAQFSISGKITDKKTGTVLSQANILIEDSYYATISNPKGEYKLTNLKPGKYSIKVSYLGYISITKTINLSKNSRMDFNMESTFILEDEVIIKALRVGERSAVTSTNIGKRELQEVNIGQDIPYLIENTPSVVVTSDAGAGVGYTGLRIRGTDITRINVTINGIPLNDPESNSVYWVDIPDLASSIEEMQIQRGVGTSTNGASAFGASINILTQKVNPEPYAEVNASYGSFNTNKTNLRFGTGLIKNKWAFDGRVSKIASDGYIDRACSDLKSFFISGSYYGKKSLLKINIFSGKEKTYQAWGGVPKDKLETDRTYNPYTYENEIDDYQQDHYHLIYSKEINKDLQLNTAAFYIKGNGYYEQYKKNSKFSNYGLDPIRIFDTLIVIGPDTTVYPDSLIKRTDLVRQKWLDNDFYGITYSLVYEKENLKAIIGGAWNKYDGDHFGKVIWARFMSNGEKDHEWYRNTGTKRDFNIFGKVEYQLTEKLNLYGDIQYRTINYSIKGLHDDLRDLTQEHNFNFINPKFGLFYDLNSKQNVYFSWAMANREPSRGNYRDADPDYLPKSEKLFDYELG